ncbi:hypothetical protein C457_16577 [Haloferax prahovense DSM 18310]|uniref:Uncharacterized protein n=1 Tax=Haloferax prahovense (strain DSM 18310 / JCM 13924 / TL6) TaxID=1227461 RepID=M0FYV7_HALPT|nr:hypothetical protein C457_16577 [Haloferax prahovense DSM 18310]
MIVFMMHKVATPREMATCRFGLSAMVELVQVLLAVPFHMLGLLQAFQRVARRSPSLLVRYR